MSQILKALKEWIPYQLILKDHEPICKWLYLDGKKFVEPFFDDTILRCKSLSLNQTRIQCLSSLNILPKWFDGETSIEPSVIIFHVSRCGSTLASQLLSLNPSSIVLSEVPFIDSILRLKHNINYSNKYEISNLLKAAIACYGQKRNGNENKLIIKTDSWHIFFYQQLRKIYPTTPFVLLYRSPDEVIRSHQKKPGMHSVPGLIEPEIFGFDLDTVLKIPRDEYMVMVLEKYFTEFINILNTDKLAIAINYKEGSTAIIEKTAKVASIQLTEAERDEIKLRAGFHAKYPNEKFIEETIIEKYPAYQSKAFELYNKLEEIRIRH